MQKEYLVKLFDISGAFKQVIWQDKIKNEFNFSGNITWWQGQWTLQLAVDFWETFVEATDVVEVYASDKNNPKGRLIYTWVVQNIQRFVDKDIVWINLPLLWLFSIFTYMLFRDWGNLSFNKNQDPSQTVRDIVDFVNIKYNFFSYDWTSIPNYWTSADLKFENEDCFSAIKKCIDVTDFYFYIDQFWKVFFKQKSSTPEHFLTIQENVEKIFFEENSENLVNNVVVKYSWGQKLYTDPWSETQYWLREQFEDEETNLNDVSTADEFWGNFLEENKNPKTKTKITLNAKFDLESIKPGETIKVRNFSFLIENLQIQKLTYSPDKVILELEEIDSFSKEVFKN